MGRYCERDKKECFAPSALPDVFADIDPRPHGRGYSLTALAGLESQARRDAYTRRVFTWPGIPTSRFIRHLPIYVVTSASRAVLQSVTFPLAGHLVDQSTQKEIPQKERI
jgi:hypothetical protein